jgi:hypothetical protein
MKRYPAFVLILLLTGAIQAGDNKTGELRAKKIAPYLDGQTVAVFYVDLSKLDEVGTFKSVAKEAGVTDEEVQMLLPKLKQQFEAFGAAGIKEIYAVSSLADLPLEPLYLVVPVEPGKADQAIQLLKELSRGKEAKLLDGAVVVGRDNRLTKLPNNPPADLARAFAATADADAQAVFVLSPLLRKAIGEAVPPLPKELGGGGVQDVVAKFQWASAGIKIGPKLSVNMVIQAQDAEAAKSLHQFTTVGLKALEKAIQQEFPAPDLSKTFLPKQDNDRLVLSLDQSQLINPIGKMLMQARLAATRMQSSNNLKQIALAMHGYHDVSGAFPAAASYGKDGKPLLSWRVHILPYVDREGLYQLFKLDEPWDSPHNKALINQMPAVYRSPNSKAAPGKTNYVVPVGKGLIFFGKKGTKITTITDGTSNTIMTLEVDDDHAVTWTKPDDLQVDLKDPMKGLGKDHGRFTAGYADGSVHILTQKTAPEWMRALLTKSGGEAIPADLEVSPMK